MFHMLDPARSTRSRPRGPGYAGATAAAKADPYGLQQVGTVRVGTLTDAPPNVARDLVEDFERALASLLA